MAATALDITLSHTSFKARRRDGAMGGLCSVLPLIGRGSFFFSEAASRLPFPSHWLDRLMGLDYSLGPFSLRFRAFSPILEASQGSLSGRRG